MHALLVSQRQTYHALLEGGEDERVKTRYCRWWECYGARSRYSYYYR